MRLKELEGLLQQVKPFETPQVQLEQYPTSSHLAAQMLFAADAHYGDIAGKAVLDLGVGCGVLGLGAAALDAGYVLGVDVSISALEMAAANAAELELPLELVRLDVAEGWQPNSGRAGAGAGAGAAGTPPATLPELQVLRGARFDTVIMNPPFGTKNNAGIDMVFLRRAVQLCTGAVYSLHKTSTRSYIERQAKQMDITGEVVAKLRYDLPQTYKFHKKASVDIEVDFWRFDCSSKSTR